MESCKDSIVKINSVPTRVLHFGVTQESCGDNGWKAVNQTIVVFISGNPGEIGHYRDLMATIHKSMALPVMGVSQGGHNRLPKDHPIPPINENKDLYSLWGQIYHKKCFIDQLISTDSKIILIGHSIGCYIILKLVDQFPDIRSKVLHSILIFPTIESMAETSEGKKYQFIFGWFKYPLICLAHILDLLSDDYKEKLVSFALKSSEPDIPDCALKSATNIMNANCLLALIHMSLNEFQTVRELDHLKDVISNNSDRLTFFYGEADEWCPLEYYHRIKKSFPDCDIRLCLANMRHAFPLNKDSTKRIAQMVVQTLKSIL